MLEAMAGEIASMLRKRAGFPVGGKLTSSVGSVVTGSGVLVQVVVSDPAGNAVSSVQVELRSPAPQVAHLSLTNRVHHGCGSHA